MKIIVQMEVRDEIILEKIHPRKLTAKADIRKSNPSTSHSDSSFFVKFAHDVNSIWSRLNSVFRCYLNRETQGLEGTSYVIDKGVLSVRSRSL